jgi:hypothetical protein
MILTFRRKLLWLSKAERVLTTRTQNLRGRAKALLSVIQRRRLLDWHLKALLNPRLLAVASSDLIQLERQVLFHFGSRRLGLSKSSQRCGLKNS